eukprot:6456081-Amphidinium_carterae.1
MLSLTSSATGLKRTQEWLRTWLQSSRLVMTALLTTSLRMRLRASGMEHVFVKVASPTANGTGVAATTHRGARVYKVRLLRSPHDIRDPAQHRWCYDLDSLCHLGHRPMHRCCKSQSHVTRSRLRRSLGSAPQRDRSSF